MEENQRCLHPSLSDTDRSVAPNGKEGAPCTPSTTNTYAAAGVSVGLVAQGTRAGDKPEGESALPPPVAQETQPATCCGALQTVHDTFKVVVDAETRTDWKIVPPYWKVLQTDVKMRWRDRELLSVLAEEFRSRPLEYYTKVLEKGEYIFVNGAACRGSTLLRNGDRISHRTLETEFALPAAPVLVLHEDANLLAAYKPPGMPVHPQGRYTQGSLLSILKTFHLKSPTEYLHPVNRLDRVTSGLVVFAKSSVYARMLSAALPSAVKLYVAEVCGDFSACVKSVKKTQRQRRRMSCTRAQCDNDEPLKSKHCSEEATTPAERTEANPLCYCACEMSAREISVSNNEPPSLPAELWDAPAETIECYGTQSTGATGARRRELKRAAKRERQLKRMRTQHPPLVLPQAHSSQPSVNEEKLCNDEAEYLTRQEATLRGIFEVVSLPGCPICGVREEGTRTATEEAAAGIPYQYSRNTDTTQGMSEDSEVSCCCGDWLHVKARLQTSSRMVGRQLTVIWSEKHGKAASTFFKHLHYNAEANSSLIACVPRTGRTHQIRKHLQCLGATAILNDSLYPKITPGATEADGAKGSKPQADTVASTVSESGGSGEQSTNRQRSSRERNVWVSFSLEELAGVNETDTAMPASKAKRESDNQAKKQSYRDDSDPQGARTLVDRLLEKASPLLDLRVSAAGDSVEIPYTLEEPWAIHLCSTAYGFNLEALGRQSAPAPHQSKEKCCVLSVHASRTASQTGRNERSLDGATAGTVSTTPSPPDTFAPSTSAQQAMKRIVISCPGNVWPSWAKSVTQLISQNIWPLLQCVET